MAAFIQLILSIPQLLGAIKALIDFASDMDAKKKKEESDKLKREIENAETEDDFRAAADKLAKSGRR